MQRQFGISAASRVGVYDGKIAGLYDLEETLGSGHFAVVKLARHVFTGEKVAVKVIEKTKLDDISRAHLFQEVRCMKLVQHPNVVRLYEVIDTQTKLYLILELGDGGDLYDYIMRHDKGLSENIAREYFRQIVRAISYCHQLHVVHRDLKPENVVFFEKLGVVKLTDFGFSNKFCPGQKLETSCGSLAYSAPEILLGDSYDAPAVDVWSLGVILFMLVCGHPPFQEANDSETLTMIMDCKYTMPPHVSEGCRKLISGMLVREPEKRSTLHQIAQNEWLTEGSSEETPEYLPLVSREQVSDEDHTLIIQKMINGKIATKEEILEALDRNEYNHITATYFLLAERKLRAHRQEQVQKRKPELTLPVSNSSRQQNSKYLEENKEQNNHLVPTKMSMHLNVPRTPGAEGCQGGRLRKCSIVQEEEDDEDDVPCAGHEELSSPLNRRGSRSEGRINVTVQDRLAEAERAKKENKAPSPVPTSTIGGIGNVTIITSENSCAKDRLGMAGGGLHRKIPEIKRIEPPKKTTILKPSIIKMSENNIRSNSLDKCIKSIKDNSDIVNTKVITDSSTINLPIPIPSLNIESETNMPKYKTMPSPTRSNAILSSTTNCLNEIFEEGTDVGSSDSTTTTPRPIVRSQFNTRAQSQGSESSSVTNSNNSNNNNVQRRTKFHKSRTASCSSSDASDDDSENRKKRAHKIVDSVTKPLPQRRDSHDDSSDSQDPSNTAAPSGNQASSCVKSIVIVNAPKDNSSGQESSSDKRNTTNSSRQKSAQQLDFRRHRGRRRPVETRLRESQSLNRITEVQESEVSSTSIVPITPQDDSNNSNNNATNTNNSTNTNNNNNNNNNNSSTKPKGLSARLFHTFKRQNPSHSNAVQTETNATNTDDIEMVLGVELAKALNVTENKGSSTKKFKILGRYFQVHKKIYVPLSGLFQRGRLYKAQSCGSIVRDKVNVNPTGARGQSSGRHSTVFNEKNRFIKNCLSGSRLLGSDGDINHNGTSVITLTSSSSANTATAASSATVKTCIA